MQSLFLCHGSVSINFSKFLGAVFNGSYPVSAWKWIDGNNDGIAESYYFDQSGYVLMNRERYFKVVFIKK